MPKTKISEFSATANSNTDINSINIAEGCAPSNINDAIRELMAELKDFQAGTKGDSFNGPVGTSTAAAGAFTTLSSTGNTTLGDASGDTVTINGTTTFANVNPTLSAGTANGVLYLNGSKVATSGSALVFDGTNLGIGNTSPTSYNGAADNLVIGSSGSNGMTIVSGTANAGYIMFADGTTGQQAYEGQITYDHSVNQMWFNVNAAEGMRLTSTGLGIGTSSPAAKLDVANASGRAARIGGFQFGGTTSSADGGNNLLSSGVYWNGSNLTATQTTGAVLQFGNGVFQFQTLSGLTAGNTYSFAPQMALDSVGNLGLGVTPSAWDSNFKAFQLGYPNFIAGNNGGNRLDIGVNAYYSTNYKYAATGVAATYYSQASGQHIFYTAPSGTAGNAISFSQALTLDANRNLLLNGTSAGASSVGTFTIFNGTAPTGSVTDGVILFAADVSSSSELRVRDEAGNVTTLSPHNFSLIPEGPSEELAWAYYSEKNGKKINVDMLKLARMVEKLTGEKLVFEE